MCGLTGIFGGDGCSVTRQQAEKALNSLSHRGPDDHGVTAFTGDGTTVCVSGRTVTGFSAAPPEAVGYLGHRRLSILDLSRAGRQPMCLDGEQSFIAFNGEVYNYVELRQQLQELGREFSTGTDTEVILNAYEEWGTSCFEKLNGMWAIAIVDLTAQEIILSRDRFGIKPLYVAERSGGLGFASEAKALLAAGLAEPRARPDVIREFLAYGQMPVGKDTFFDGIYQLVPGSYTRFSLRTLAAIESVRWWEISPTSVDVKDETVAWKRLFLDSLRIRMRSDVPVGSCLSGGLDSSSIVSGVAAISQSPHAFNTFTSCYSDPRYDEKHFAEEIVDHVGAKPHWIYPGERRSLSDDLKDLVNVQGEPFPTLSIYSQYCVMRGAHEAGIKVLLDGQGADELLVGYDYSLALKLAIDLKNGRYRDVLHMMRRLNREREGLSYARLLSLMVYNGAPFINRVRNDRRVGPYLGRATKAAEPAGSAGTGIPDCMSDARRNWIERHPLPHLLRYEDRNSMAFSIETRLPFLDYRLVNLAFGLSDKAMNNGGWTKYIVRESMQDLVPENVLWRKSKMGFPAPTVGFMEQNRREFGALFADDARSGDLLTVSNVRRIFESRSIENWHWRFVSLELWMRAFDVAV